MKGVYLVCVLSRAREGFWEGLNESALLTTVRIVRLVLSIEAKGFAVPGSKRVLVGIRTRDLEICNLTRYHCATRTVMFTTTRIV